MQIESNSRRNVRKIDSTLKRMDGMRSEKKKWASNMRTVAKRLTFEKDCVEQRLLFEKKVRVNYLFLSQLYLIPFFLNCIKALQRKAQKYNVEKKESNTKRRKVDEKLRTMEGTQRRLQQQLADAQNVIVALPEELAVAVRYKERNRGMTPQFEAHVRSMMATGASARQVRDNLALNASHFLGESGSFQYKKDIPTERWFSLQREALGVRRPTPSQTPSLTQLFNLFPNAKLKRSASALTAFRIFPLAHHEIG